MEICEKLHIPRDIRQITMDEVRDADEVIVLSSSKLMTRACELDGSPVGQKDQELFEKIRNAYFDMLEEDTGYRMEI